MQIETNAKVLRALLSVLERMPLTTMEGLFIEQIFGDWFGQLTAQQPPTEAPSDPSASVSGSSLPYEGIESTIN